MTVKACWRCGSVFQFSRHHKRTGYDVIVCANQNCNAPADINDDIALTIMEDEGRRDWRAKRYVEQWHAVRNGKWLEPYADPDIDALVDEE